MTTTGQTRPYTHTHCACYYRIRTAVRVLFWGAVTFAVLALLAHFGLLPDDYRDTCESLGVVCGK